MNGPSHGQSSEKGGYLSGSKGRDDRALQGVPRRGIMPGGLTDNDQEIARNHPAREFRFTRHGGMRKQAERRVDLLQVECAKREREVECYGEVDIEQRRGSLLRAASNHEPGKLGIFEFFAK